MAPEDLAHDAAIPDLLEVLRAAELYLNYGHSEQQHTRLTRAVARARESIDRNQRVNRRANAY